MWRPLVFFGLILITPCTQALGQNLVANPSFEGTPNPAGWDPIWTRDPGAATEAIDADRPPSPGEGNSVEVVSTGARDWSVAQSKAIDVREGDILEISGWIEGEGDGTAQISLHTCDRAGNTLDWMAGLLEGGGTHGWRRFDRRFVAPAGCATVQYRFTGDGHETCRLASPSLERIGNVSALISKWNGRVYTLSSGAMSVRFNPAHATMALIDSPQRHFGEENRAVVNTKGFGPLTANPGGTTRRGRTRFHPFRWAQPMEGRLENRAFRVECAGGPWSPETPSGPPVRLPFSSTRVSAAHDVWWQTPRDAAVLVTSVRQASPRELRATLWDAANDLTFTAALELETASHPELTVTLTGSGALATPLEFPQPFQTAPGESLVVPLNEGILYPVDDPAIDPIRMPTYMGNSTSMPWLGIVNASGAGVLTLIQTPDDADFDITRPTAPGTLLAQPMWEGSRGRFSYSRKLTYVLFDGGGYVAQAKWYRAYARRTGLLKTLARKRSSNPNVDKLIGAANVWTWERNKVEICREMKSLGMDRVLWSGGGSADEIDQINKLGFLTSRYDIYQDAWPSTAPDYLHKEGWPDDLVLLPNGDWMKGWAHIVTNPDGSQTTYQGGVINSARGLARAKREIPDDLRSTAYECRFLDTTTASPWREDYSPAHPLTRSEDRANKMALLAFCSGDMRLVTGSETGIDAAVPFVDYFEGMMSLSKYRLADAGRNMLPAEPPTPDILNFMVGPKYRIPLWDLVYHDCVVSYWYWGDYNNKILDVWPKRDLYDILYAEPPMYMFDKNTWETEKARIAQSAASICPIARRFGYEEMLSHAFLTSDHAVQETVWADGARILVNFGDSARTVDGARIPALGFKIVERGARP